MNGKTLTSGDGLSSGLGKTLLICCLLGYLAILSVSGTIALRNLLLLLSVVLIFFGASQEVARPKYSVKSFIGQLPWVFLLWAAYLILFPLWSVETQVAWKNLAGQWLETIIAWGVGFGAAWILGARAPSLWLLALASAFPVMFHLMLTLLAWTGMLGPEMLADPSLHALWGTVRAWLAGNVGVPHMQAFPLGFRGVEPMHGNIGYAACQTIALAAACFASAWRAGQRDGLFRSGTLIVVSFVSIFIAYSRGAALFAVLVLLGALLLYGMKYRSNIAPAARSEWDRLASFRAVVVLVALATIAAVGWQSVRNDMRWRSMADKMELGLTVQNPEQVLCEGLSEPEKDAVRRRFSGRDPQYVEELISGLEGQDGARLLLMREGWKLVLETPLGLDGSRQAYQKLMRKTCGHVPKLDHAHAHQAWINMTLSLGWAGGGIFALLMGYFVATGWRSAGKNDLEFWGFALFLLAVFWVLRGFFDAVYQDHYLQMQGFLLAYLYVEIKRRAARSNGAGNFG